MLSSARKLRSRTIDALSPALSPVRAPVEDEDSVNDPLVEEEKEEGPDEETKEEKVVPKVMDLEPMELDEKLRLTTKKRIFALSPGQYSRDEFLDFGKKESILLYNKIIEPLQNKFDGDSEQIMTFIEQLLRRAKSAGFDNIVNIQDDDGIKRNLFVEYGCLSKKDIEYYVNSYANTETRQAQNDFMLGELLLNSVTENFHMKIVGHTDDYDVLGHKSGSLLFKLMMSKSIVDTKATSTLYRERLMALDDQMKKVDSNIDEFNHYVKVNIKGLTARGEAMDDIMVSLFKGYL